MKFDFNKYRDNIEALHDTITNTTIAVLEMVANTGNLEKIEYERLNNLIKKGEVLLEDMVKLEKYEQAARLKESLDIFEQTKRERYGDDSSTEEQEKDDPTVSGSH